MKIYLVEQNEFGKTWDYVQAQVIVAPSRSVAIAMFNDSNEFCLSDITCTCIGTPNKTHMKPRTICTDFLEG